MCFPRYYFITGGVLIKRRAERRGRANRACAVRCWLKREEARGWHGHKEPLGGLQTPWPGARTRTDLPKEESSGAGHGLQTSGAVGAARGTHMLWRTHQPQWGSREPRHSSQLSYCSQLSTGTRVTCGTRQGVKEGTGCWGQQGQQGVTLPGIPPARRAQRGADPSGERLGHDTVGFGSSARTISPGWPSKARTGKLCFAEFREGLSPSSQLLLHTPVAGSPAPKGLRLLY